MFNKIALILGIWAVGYMAWAGNFFVAQAREKNRINTNPTFFSPRIASSSEPTQTPIYSKTPKPTHTPKLTKTPVPTATASSSPAFSPSPSPSSSETPQPTPEHKTVTGLAASIANFFKGNSGLPPSMGRGLNTLSVGPEASPYAPASQSRFWYVLTGTLALVGMSTLMYGRSKHS